MERTLECGCFVSGAIQMCPMHAAAPELLSETEINLGVLREVHVYLRNRSGNVEVQLCAMVGESISHSEAAIAKAKGL